tara:strand:- start:7091 stop:8374 length:1284 start_codon:yes stop_codon:yes gene_type:complete
MGDLFKKKSKSGFPPYFEDTIQDIVRGDPADAPEGAGVSLHHQWMRGAPDPFPEDMVSDLTPSQLEDLIRIRGFGVEQSRPGSTLGQAAGQLGTLYDASGDLASQATAEAAADRDLARGSAATATGRAAEVGRYGTGLMSYGGDAARTGLSQGQYAEYTPFEVNQLREMLEGDVPIAQLEGVQKAMTQQGMRAMRPEFANIRARTGEYQRGGGTGTVKDRMMAEEKFGEQMSQAWAPYAYAAHEAAQARRIPAGQLALQAQFKAMDQGVTGAQLGLGAGGLDVAAGGLNIQGGQLMQQGVSNAQQARMLGLNAAQLAPTITAGQMGGLQSALQTGNIRQAQDQAERSADIASWDKAQNREMLFARNMLDLMGSARVPTIKTSTPSLGSTLLNMRPLLGYGQATQPTTPEEEEEVSMNWMGRPGERYV